MGYLFSRLILEDRMDFNIFEKLLLRSRVGVGMRVTRVITTRIRRSLAVYTREQYNILYYYVIRHLHVIM